MNYEYATPCLCWLGVCFPSSAYARFNYYLHVGDPMEPQGREMVEKRTSKWGCLGELVAKLKEGESIVLEVEGDPVEEACKIRSRLSGIRICRTVRRAVQVVNGKIVITRIGCWPMLSAFRYTPVSQPNRSRASD